MIRIKFLAIIFLFLMFACNNKKESDLITFRQKKLDHIDYKRNNDLKEKKVSLSQNKLKMFIGNWKYKLNNEFQDYTLDIKEESSVVSLSYSFIRNSGQYIDFSESFFTIKYDKGHYYVDFESAFEDNLIKCELILEDSETLILKTLTDPGTSFFHDNMIFKRINK